LLGVDGGSHASDSPEYFIHGLGSRFNLPCNNHDVCYQTCVRLSEKTWQQRFHECNAAQYQEAKAVCRKAYPNAVCPDSMAAACLMAGGCAKYLQERATCFEQAKAYFDGVEAPRAYERFTQRQADYCAD
jgi:hypothetical protein